MDLGPLHTLSRFQSGLTGLSLYSGALRNPKLQDCVLFLKETLLCLGYGNREIKTCKYKKGWGRGGGVSETEEAEIFYVSY